jgi:hypothetical protein
MRLADFDPTEQAALLDVFRPIIAKRVAERRRQRAGAPADSPPAQASGAIDAPRPSPGLRRASRGK